MGRRTVGRRDAGGGARIPALRAKRALIALLAGVAIAAAGAYPALASERLREPLAIVTAVALLALAVGVIGRWAFLIQLALALPLGAYAAFLVDRGDVDSAAPFVAAGMVIAAELAFASLEPPTTRRAAYRSAVLVALAAAGAVALGALLIGTASTGRGTLVEYAFGVGAAALAVATLTWLTWSGSRRASDARR